MCSTFPDGSLKPKNYATRALPSVPNGPYVDKGKTIGLDYEAEISSRKEVKKRRRETREDFSRKRKVHAFRGDSALERSPWKFPQRKEKFGSRPRTI
jgi:hypothetical protein